MAWNRKSARKGIMLIPELSRVNYPLEMDLSPLSFVDVYQHTLPELVRVSTGYCGVDGLQFTFSTQETYLISHVLAQERVILKDHNKQLLSFPSDHRLEFKTIINGLVSHKSWRLNDLLALDEVSMTSHKIFLRPVNNPNRVIQFLLSPNNSTTLELADFELIESYDERYLVGNYFNGETMHTLATIIPLWLPITFDVADSMTNETELYFKQFKERLNKDCRTYLNAHIPGNKEIMLFEGEFGEYEGPYDVIQPRNSNYSHVKKEQLGSLVELPPVPDRRPSIKTTTHRECLKSEKQKKAGLSVTQKGPHAKQNHYLREPASKAVIHDHNDGPGDYYDEVEPQSRDFNSSNHGSQRSLPQTPSHNDVAKSFHKHTSESEAGVESKPPPAVNKPKVALKPAMVKQGTVTKSDGLNHVLAREAAALVNRKAKPDEGNRGNEQEYEDYEPTYPELEPEVESEYACLRDIPLSVKSMTVEQVAECLVHLKLNKHVDRFVEDSVDGDLLSDLNEQNLIDFGLNSYEAKKLMKFVGGWRPK